MTEATVWMKFEALHQGNEARHKNHRLYDSTYMTSLKGQNQQGRKQVSGSEEWGGLKRGMREFGGAGGGKNFALIGSLNI